MEREMSRSNRVLEKKPVSSFKELMKEYGSPYGFYRSLYKAGVGVNITVEFKLNDDIWEKSGDDLPRRDSIYNPLSATPSSKIEILGVGISSIVEGSDAEVPLVWTEPHNFWDTLEGVESEVKDLWEDYNWENNTVETLKTHVRGWLEFEVWPVLGGKPTNHKGLLTFIMLDIVGNTVPVEYKVEDFQSALRRYVEKVGVGK